MKKYKLRKFNYLIIAILVIGLIFSIYNIFKWYNDNSNIAVLEDNIQDMVNVEEVNDSESTILVNQDNSTPDFNPYWDYIKMKFINVNLSALKNYNDETVGWIQVKGTNINYPFVQTNNNSYYLNHSFDKSINQAGWVFLDYRNNINNLDKNTIIYAHGRIDKTMFGSLKNILTNGWLDDTNNYVIKVSTESINSLWQVFSVYRINTTNDYLKTSFNNDDEFNEFSKMLLDRSSYNFNTNINANDKILTLSTCYNNTDKVVLHAKLIKMETK